MTRPASLSALGTIQLRMGNHLIQSYVPGDVATVQAAVSLLRTGFENHFVDPDCPPGPYFNGHTLAGPHDFSVIHRDGRVHLSDFTRLPNGPTLMSLPLPLYAHHILRFADRVLAAGVTQTNPMPDWLRRHAADLVRQLMELADLCRLFLVEGAGSHVNYAQEYHDRHGRMKRPLELEVVEVLAEGATDSPIVVLANIRFGPIWAKQQLPVRLNRGDIILATVSGFTPEGVQLVLEGVGSGGVEPGDGLFGLQLFYP